jgi:hypothetical protein
MAAGALRFAKGPEGPWHTYKVNCVEPGVSVSGTGGQVMMNWAKISVH